jgi:predicted nucleic acid-binding protein
MIERNDELYTSTLSLGEILVKPTRLEREDRVEQYRRAIETVATVVAFDRVAALEFGRIRRDPGIGSPDAIQLSCAAVSGVDLFITNDDRLSQKHVEGIHFIASLERAHLLLGPR